MNASTETTHPQSSYPESFLSCDWGTSSFRLRLIRIQDGQVLHETKKNIGVKSVFLQRDPSQNTDRDKRFESFLTRECDQLLEVAQCATTEMIMMLSGMTTSSIGWVELPYARAPFPLDGSRVVVQSKEIITDRGRRIQCRLISGIQTEKEMMRGEETELMGVFAKERYKGLTVECLAVVPGTHSKHVRIKDGSIQSIETFMTGELLEVLCRHSVLQATANLECVFEQEFRMNSKSQHDAFECGVQLAKQSGLLGNLFQTRTRGVLHGSNATDNIWFLMGLLIGDEWCRLTARHESGIPVLIAAGSRFGELYLKAAGIIGIEGRLSCVLPEDMDLASSEGHRMLLFSNAMMSEQDK
ncbi:MAG: hypothetical protein HOH33_01930 [Verrucomicrobia bacterium]|jgi:2-dehydro-3-deoxygalactonokinase|nr:hypothetical protein [Verrucomicrobiota bacterium]